jgi:sugar lactone lactonase YvrE
MEERSCWLSQQAITSIYKIDPDGKVALFYAELLAPRGLCLDSQNNLLAIMHGNPYLLKFDTSVGKRMDERLLSADMANEVFSHPWGVAEDSEGGIIVSSTVQGRVVRLTKAGTKAETAVDIWTQPASGYQRPFGITVDAKDFVHIVSWDIGKVIKVNLKGEEQFVYYEPRRVLNVVDIAVLSNGIILVTCTGKERIAWINAKGTTSGTFKAAIKAPGGLTVDEHDNVYVCEHGEGRVLKIPTDDDGNAGESEVIASGIAFIYDASNPNSHHPSGIVARSL